MKKLLLILLFIPLIGTAQFGDIIKKATEAAKTVTTTTTTTTTGSGINTKGLDISAGLKEALNKGIEVQVSKLTAMDGFYKNEAVKILMPDELKKVDAMMRSIGMSKLADDGIKSLNRAAEDAVKEATPIFVKAVKNISITNAKDILMGADNSATLYLQGATNTDLYAKFNPVVKTSLGKVGADAIWANIITKYNALPFISKINPDLNDYVTQKALDGVFTMITVEEKNIRGKLSSRSSTLLKKVFALQDKK